MNHSKNHSKNADKNDRVGATPGKLALIGVLGMVLVISAVMNFGNFRD